MELTDINNVKETGSLPAIEEVFGKDSVVYKPGAYIIPQLGIAKWDGHIYISGATGAGKSYLIKQIISADKSNRKVYLFSSVKDDPSLSGLAMHDFVKGESSLQDSISIFDDYDKSMQSFVDDVLEKGRHENAMAIVVNHKHREWRQTMKPLNESKYVILFPSANKATALHEMKMLGMNYAKRNQIVELAQRHGRYMIIHQHAPNAVITQQAVITL